ncbi:rieske (2Fe-2S) domain protein [Desulfovibrio ferrophilus]|uniref:Rieske (2Fe-2S) domain protein n=2 Tax=Desulfovibrio ferrophilus TaxID=241368 RepID=A0A2Z6AYZ5_9BACT|nr:rieske (2Fe-2S) domain protein [Desulfovibrio ferrophilus]
MKSALHLVIAGLVAWPVLRFVSWRRAGTRRVRFGPEEQTDHSYRDGVYLIRTDSGLLALSARCTHLCCTVCWQESRGQFLCPCHDSRYDARGRRLSGQAREDLTSLEIHHLGNGSIEVEAPL